MAEPIAEVGYLAGLCGHDGTNWLKIKTDANGYLYVVGTGTAGAMEVTQDTPGDLLMGQHQYDGSAWRKSNLLWGYHDNWIEGIYEQAASTTTWAWTATEVPPGEVWVANCCLGVNYTRDPSNVRFMIVRDSSYYYLDWKATPGLGVAFSWGGAVALKEGDILRVDIGGTVEDDYVAANVIGYKMDISM